ncbi:MAG TPA: cytochrome d ubiquinol oxidase subunit II [Actinocatenispora sp.]
MDIALSALLLVLLAGWFVLDGYGLGTGILLRPLAPAGWPRRRVITGVAPVLLANEMWLVAAAGLLAGVFPGAERTLAAAYPAVVPGLAAWVLRDAGLWLRGRRESLRWHRFWESAYTGGSIVFGFSWGLLLGDLAVGLPAAAGLGDLAVGWFPIACGVAVVLLLAAHGAVFTAVRVPSAADRARALAARLTVPAAAVTAAVALAGLLLPAVRDRLAPAAVLVLFAPAGLLLARRCLARGRTRAALAGTSVAAAAPVLAVLGCAVPTLVRLAGESTAVGVALLAVAPVVLAHQALLWWLFRRPVTDRTVAFF